MAAFDKADVALTVKAEREWVPRDTEPRPGAQTLWNWAHVTVTAQWGEHVGTADLGGCDYESEADFLANCTSYPSLCDEAIANLIDRMEGQQA